MGETRSEMSKQEGVVQGSHSERAKVLSEHGDIRNFFEVQACQAVLRRKSCSNKII